MKGRVFGHFCLYLQFCRSIVYVLGRIKTLLDRNFMISFNIRCSKDHVFRRGSEMGPPMTSRQRPVRLSARCAATDSEGANGASR